MNRLLLCVFSLTCCVSSAQAQAPSALRGSVTDPQHRVVPGASIIVSGPELQGQREAVSDAIGSYVFLGLPPGTYVLAAALPGFANYTQSEVTIRAGQTITLDVQLSVATLETSVTVEGNDRSDVPIVDVTNPELQFNLSAEFLKQLPLGSRQQWDHLWQLVPGVITYARTGDANIEPRIHGASERSNVMKLDGFDLGNGFTNQQWTTQFSTEVIQDVSIKTSGLDASTPLARGGFLDIVTKSGGNTTRGSVALFAQPRRWNGNNVPNGHPSDERFVQPDGSLGGPIVRDRTWYFASYRGAYIDEGIARSASAIQAFVDNGFAVPDYDKTTRSNRLFGKVTHRVGDGRTLAVTYLDDRGTVFRSDSNERTTTEATINKLSGGPRTQVAFDGVVRRRLLLTARYGYRRERSTVAAGGGETTPSTIRYNFAFRSNGLLFGLDPAIYYGNRSGLAVWSRGLSDVHEATADMTYLPAAFGGRHQLQTGFQYKPRSRGQSDRYFPANGPALIEEFPRRRADGTIFYLPFHRQTRIPAGITAFDMRYALAGAYLQDKWTPTSRLTVTIGARYDYQTTHDNFGLWSLHAGSFNPRLGAAYALSAGNRDVVRASWGRINDLMYAQAAPNAAFATSGTVDEYDLDLNQSFETAITTPAVLTFALPADRLFDSNTKTPISDEAHVGYTRQLPGRVIFDAAYIHRVFKNEIGEVDSNILYDGGLFRGYRNEAFNAVPLTTNLEGVRTLYNAFEFSVIRNVGARWQAFANYTYQRSSLNGAWRQDEAEHYLYPASWFNQDKLVPPHILRVSGSFIGPWAITSAFVYTIRSGDYSAPVTTILTAPDPAFGPETLTLSNGRIVLNPLATTTRLVGPRGANVLQSPSVPRLNLRFGKRFGVGRTTLEVNGDIFNITNNGAPLFFRSTNNTSPDFGKFLSDTQAPRAAQVSIVFRF